LQTTRLSTSLEGLYSSLAQSAGYLCRDERTVKFFSPSPILMHKNWIRCSPDPENVWKSVPSSLDPPMYNQVFLFFLRGKIYTAFWHFQYWTRKCLFCYQVHPIQSWY